MIHFIAQHLFGLSMAWLLCALLSGCYFKVQLLRWTFGLWIFIWWFIVIMVFGEEVMIRITATWQYLNRKK